MAQQKKRQAKTQAKTPGRTRSGGAARSAARSGSPRTAAAAPKARLGDWIRAARPATLGLAIAPVVIGVGAAVIIKQWSLGTSLLALAVALLLQLGANFANDYSDGVRGTDRERVGPTRLVGSGRATPRTVLLVALAFFGLAAVAGLLIVLRTGHWWLLAAGAVAIAAGWLYAGGPKPYGSFGLGEVFVFGFFGLAATLGTTYVNAGSLNQEAWFGAIGIGSIAVAVLLINNLRDRETDRAAGKITLSVLIGAVATKALIVLTLLVVPAAVLIVFGLAYPDTGLAFFAGLAAVPAAIIALSGRTPGELVTALKLAGLAGLIYGVLLGLLLAF